MGLQLCLISCEVQSSESIKVDFWVTLIKRKRVHAVFQVYYALRHFAKTNMKYVLPVMISAYFIHRNRLGQHLTVPHTYPF